MEEKEMSENPDPKIRPIDGLDKGEMIVSLTAGYPMKGRKEFNTKKMEEQK